MSYPSSFNTIGNPFTLLDSVDSTNNYAMAKLQSGSVSHGEAFFALEQTAGKGQRGRTWATEKGANITTSVVVEPFPTSVSHQFQLSVAIALGCYDFFKKFAGDETSIKWPNDIYWRDRKAGGILIENVISASGNWSWAVIGMGLNINQTDFAESANRPVSLKQITGKHFDIITLAGEMYASLDKRYHLLRNQPFKNLLSEYNHALFMKDQRVTLKKGAIVFETRIKEVNNFGKLITEDSLHREFDFGEVTWVL